MLQINPRSSRSLAMPRKPTIHQKKAREAITELIRALPSSQPLPTLRDLGEAFELHPSTISRLLRDLETEGLIWQGSSGRFFAAGERSEILRGAPVCFIGREMMHWSQLYQELLAGVSEVCSANSSPLIFQAAPNLVRVPVLLEPPIFGDIPSQVKELKALVKGIPKGCSGFLLDHLWSQEAINSVSFPSGQRVRLLYGEGKRRKVISPDYGAGVEMTVQHVRNGGFKRIFLVIPFEGEPLIDDCIRRLRIALAPLGCEEILFQDKKRISALATEGDERICLVCPEDNTALGLANLIRRTKPSGAPDRLEIMATQGTGVVTAPHSRLRFDYRRLGRAAVSHILHGTPFKPMKPTLVTRSED